MQLKIIISLYQMLVRIGPVYEIEIPAEITAVLRNMEWAISFGLEGIEGQFACLGWGGYVARIRFWIVAPAVGSLIIGLIAAAVVTCSREAAAFQRPSLKGAAQSILVLTRRFSSSIACLQRRSNTAASRKYRTESLPANDSGRPKTVLEAALPPVLWLLFFSYPLVANVAFAAFPCYALDDGEWLRADVSIKCHGPEHRSAISLAVIAIVLYPIGLPLVCSIMLYRAREAIQSREPTSLSKSIAFLWREFKSEYYWWEVSVGRPNRLRLPRHLPPSMKLSMIQLTI